jgi:hypothetical protein
MTGDDSTNTESINDMNYALAKQLKDAGFRQNVTGDGNFSMPDGSFQHPMDAAKKYPQSCYVPTLSELIEACGKDFAFLAKADDGIEWKATAASFGRVGEMIISASGSTPEEAVAKLWLALQREK